MITGNASKWVQRQVIDNDEEDGEVDYDNLVELLKQKYQVTQSRVFQLRTELTNIRQNEIETVDEYADRVERLCSLINLEDIPSRTHHFVNGLQPDIRRHVLRMQPVDMETALNAARTEEGAQGLMLNSSNTLDQVVAKVIEKLSIAVDTKAPKVDTFAGSKSRIQNINCQMCQRTGHEAQECPNISATSRAVCQLTSATQSRKWTK